MGPPAITDRRENPGVPPPYPPGSAFWKGHFPKVLGATRSAVGPVSARTPDLGSGVPCKRMAEMLTKYWDAFSGVAWGSLHALFTAVSSRSGRTLVQGVGIGGHDVGNEVRQSVGSQFIWRSPRETRAVQCDPEGGRESV